jgi:hypothetical protein
MEPWRRHRAAELYFVGEQFAQAIKASRDRTRAEQRPRFSKTPDE